MTAPLPGADDTRTVGTLLRLWTGVAIILGAVVVWGAVQPVDPLEHIIRTDTQRHILAFGTIGLCAGLMPTARARLLGLSAAVAFGALVELIQIPLPDRTASISDLFASTVGVFGGFGLASAAGTAATALRGRLTLSLRTAAQPR